MDQVSIFDILMHHCSWQARQTQTIERHMMAGCQAGRWDDRWLFAFGIDEVISNFFVKPSAAGMGEYRMHLHFIAGGMFNLGDLQFGGGDPDKWIGA